MGYVWVLRTNVVGDRLPIPPTPELSLALLPWIPHPLFPPSPLAPPSVRAPSKHYAFYDLGALPLTPTQNQPPARWRLPPVCLLFPSPPPPPPLSHCPPVLPSPPLPVRHSLLMKGGPGGSKPHGGLRCVFVCAATVLLWELHGAWHPQRTGTGWTGITSMPSSVSRTRWTRTCPPFSRVWSGAEPAASCVRTWLLFHSPCGVRSVFAIPPPHARCIPRESHRLGRWEEARVAVGVGVGWG